MMKLLATILTLAATNSLAVEFEKPYVANGMLVFALHHSEQVQPEIDQPTSAYEHFGEYGTEAEPNGEVMAIAVSRLNWMIEVSWTEQIVVGRGSGPYSYNYRYDKHSAVQIVTMGGKVFYGKPPMSDYIEALGSDQGIAYLDYVGKRYLPPEADAVPKR